MKKANRKEFYSHLSALYQLSPEVISPVLREKLVEFAQKLDHSDNLYMLASQLSAYVNRELLEQAGKAPKELLDLASYIQELQVSHSRYMARLDNLQEFRMKKANREEFYSHLSALYQLSPETISPVLREKLVEFAQKLDHSDNLYLLADQLSVFVNAELTGLTWRAPKELVELGRYIQELQVTYRRYVLGIDDLEEK